MATERFNKNIPINLGSGQEIRIKDLAILVAKIVKYTGEIEWDDSKPDGQPRRRLDVNKAEKEFGFSSKYELTEGLKNTIRWYKDKYGN